jgi:hypothetical protein
MAHFFNTSPTQIEQMDFLKFRDSVEYMNEVNKQRENN